MLRKVLLLFLITPFFLGYSQMLQDEEAKKTVEKVLHWHYNNNETKARTEIQKLKPKYSKHPIYPLLMSMTLLGELSEEAKAEEYMAYLDLAEIQSYALLEENPNDIEGMFFAMTTHSYKALFYSEQNNYLKAVGEAQRTYRYIKKAYDLTDKFPEFLLSVGLYNFYREQYPETHPAVKPLIGIFKNGDRALGLQQLQKCVEKTTFTRPEALSYITHIYLKYENDYSKGLKYGKIAFDEFSKNPYFETRYTEALLRNNKAEEAIKHIKALQEQDEKLYQTIATAFEGFYYEQLIKDDKLALKAYAKAMKTFKNDEDLEQDYLCWCQAGLARIMDRKGQVDAAKDLYKEAQNGEYESIRKEAKAYLKAH